MRTKRPILNLQVTITLLVCGVVGLALCVTELFISHEIGSTTKDNQSDKAMTIARMVAHSSITINTLQGKSNQAGLEKYTNKMTKVSNVEFIVVLDMNGIRESHPDPNKIGKHFVGGDEGPVLNGQESVSTAKGTLGYSLRAFTPVYANNGKQIGAVAVGISLNQVNDNVKKSKIIIYIAVLFGLLIGIIGAIILARQIKNKMFGLEPVEIGKLLEERSAMLQSTKEGILAVDEELCITLINNEAKRLLDEAGVRKELVGKGIDSVLPQLRLNDVLETGNPKYNEEIVVAGITLLSNQLPIVVGNERVGVITTFRDKTEMNKLAEELTGVKLYAEALRAQSHEFMNKLHVILGLVHLQKYERLSGYISQISDHLQNEVGYIVSKIKDPALAGFILGKMSYVREVGADLSFTGENVLPEPLQPEMTHELITIIGNLIDNAVEALKDQQNKNKRISLHFDYYEQELSIEVTDNGPGIEESMIDQVYNKGVSNKGNDRGIGLFLVKNSLDRLQGKIDISTKRGKGTRFVLIIPYKTKV